MANIHIVSAAYLRRCFFLFLCVEFVGVVCPQGMIILLRPDNYCVFDFVYLLKKHTFALKNGVRT